VQTRANRRVEGPAQAAGTGDGRARQSSKRQRVSLDREGKGNRKLAIQPLFAGGRSDPFFFGPLAVTLETTFSSRRFLPTRTFCSIVWTCPTQPLGDPRRDWPFGLGRWERTGSWVQADDSAVRCPAHPCLPARKRKNAPPPQEPATKRCPVIAGFCALAGGNAGGNLFRAAGQRKARKPKGKRSGSTARVAS